MAGHDPAVLLRAAQAGDRRALGRLLSLVEQGGPRGRETARLTFGPSAGVEMVIGVTGAPGAGKSTLAAGLARAARRAGRSVGVLAVDPSSPRSGGALLGDRIRMSGHAGDPEVFVRSMAARGHRGGLALAAPEAIRVLAAAGMGVVLVETVGVGQAEVEVAGAADTTVVVVNPGWGDDVQAAKAGLLEVADVFVVNKADRPGAEQARRDLAAMLELAPAGPGGWRPPILSTVASTGEGMAGLWEAAVAHHGFLEATGELGERRRRQLVAEATHALLRRLGQDVSTVIGSPTGQGVVARMLDRLVDPTDAAVELAAFLGVC